MCHCYFTMTSIFTAKKKHNKKDRLGIIPACILSSAYLCSDLLIPVPWKKIPQKFTMPRASDNLNTRWLEIPHAISKASHSMQISFKCLVATTSTGLFFADQKILKDFLSKWSLWNFGIARQQVDRGGELKWWFVTWHLMSEEEISLNPNNAPLQVIREIPSKPTIHLLIVWSSQNG